MHSSFYPYTYCTIVSSFCSKSEYHNSVRDFWRPSHVCIIEYLVVQNLCKHMHSNMFDGMKWNRKWKVRNQTRGLLAWADILSYRHHAEKCQLFNDPKSYSIKPRAQKNGRLEKERVTPYESTNQLKITANIKNSNMFCTCCVEISHCYVYGALFLVQFNNYYGLLEPD